MTTLAPRMKNPAEIIPDAVQPIQALYATAYKGGVPPAERAALSLAEPVTRLSDRPDPVPDDLWTEVTHHYNETAMAGLLLSIATVNVFNRLNVPTRQIAGAQKW